MRLDFSPVAGSTFEISSQFSLEIRSRKVSAIFHKFKAWLEPSRYYYLDPDTNREFTAPDRAGLITLIVNYRKNNQLEPIGNLNSVLENFWCGLPENAGKCERYNLHRSFEMYKKGAMALLRDLIYKKEARVSQDEANRRATLCIKCPFNIEAKKTGTMALADEVVEKYLGDNTRTPYDKDLGLCAVCTCVLRFKVHVKGPFENSAEQSEQLRRVIITDDQGQKHKCWQVDIQRT